MNITTPERYKSYDLSPVQKEKSFTDINKFDAKKINIDINSCRATFTENMLSEIISFNSSIEIDYEGTGGNIVATLSAIVIKNPHTYKTEYTINVLDEDLFYKGYDLILDKIDEYKKKVGERCRDMGLPYLL